MYTEDFVPVTRSGLLAVVNIKPVLSWLLSDHIMFAVVWDREGNNLDETL